MANALALKHCPLIVFFLLLVTTPAVAETSPIPWPNLEYVIRGDYLRAGVIAYSDFSELLKKAQQPTEAPDEGGDLVNYMSRIENYNIEISLGSGRYIIWIHPRLSKEFPAIFGGDAKYVIDAASFQVLEKQYGK